MGTSYNPKIVTDGLILNLDPANVKSYPANQDPFVNNVSLMLDFNQDFTDKSINSSTVVSNGSAAISSIQSKFGNYSGSFTNSNSYLQIANSSLFNLTSSNFTIEAWVYPTTSSGDRVIVAKNQGSYLTGYEWWFGINNNNTVAFTFTDSNTTFYSAGTVTTVSANTWTHIAAVRSGNTVTVYINGVSSATVGAQTVKTTASDVSIARDLETTGGGGRYYTGYIDDLRITKAARYTANFTPPTAPLSLPGRLTDLTKNKISSTLTNTTFTSSNGGLLTYNGSSSTTVGSSAITGVSEFTVMVWFNSSSIVNHKNVLDFNYNFNGIGSSNTGPRLEMTSAGSLFWWFSGSSTNSPTVNSYIAAKSSSLQTNTWYCAVVTRDNSLNVKAYLNGVDSGNSVIQAGGNNSAFIGSFNKITTGVGCYPNSDRYLSGYVSIILAYNRALTAAEVLQNYNATKGRFR